MNLCFWKMRSAVLWSHSLTGYALIFPLFELIVFLSCNVTCYSILCCSSRSIIRYFLLIILIHRSISCGVFWRRIFRVFVRVQLKGKCSVLLISIYREQNHPVDALREYSYFGDGPAPKGIPLNLGRDEIPKLWPLCRRRWVLDLKNCTNNYVRAPRHYVANDYY